jgi:cytochrome P450
MTGSAATTHPSFPFAQSANPFETPAEERRLAAQAPLSRVVLPTGATAWLVTGHAEVRELLRHPGFSSEFDRPGFPLLRELPPDFDAQRNRAGAFIRMDAPEHTRYRRLLTPEFMIKGVQRLEPLIHQTVDRFLDAMIGAGPPADLVEAYALPVPSLVICHLLGVPYADHDYFQERSRLLLSRSTPVDQVRQAADDLRGYLGELVARKQREGGDDLVARLVARIGTDGLTRADVAGVALLLLIAGHETTANMIGLSTLVLLEHPEQYAALGADPDRAPAIVEELLRYLSIVRNGLTRVAVADVEIGGELIRAGEGVIVLVSAANRDETVFPGADRFDVERGALQHVAFGFGVHQCIGQPLARTELRIAMATLARRLPRLRLAVPAAELPMRHDSIVFGVQRAPVTW